MNIDVLQPNKEKQCTAKMGEEIELPEGEEMWIQHGRFA